MSVLTKKQKKTLYRILGVLAVFIVLLILDHTGAFSKVPPVLVFFIYFIPYLVIGYDVLVKAYKNIRNGQVFDENFLMMIATLAAFGLGLFGENEYNEALAVMLFYQIGELFQGYAVGKSRRSITEMMSIAPEYANLVLEDGSISEEDPEDVHPGDKIVVRPGEKIPLDGVVLEGESFLDTAALTGEAVHRRAVPGDAVISGCINRDRVLTIEVTREYEDSTVAKILELVENASSRKAKLENFITRFARVYTPVVTIGAVLLAVLLPLLFKVSWADGIRRACNFLIVSCPCALVISVPLGFFGGIGAASKLGIMVKGSNYLEAASRLKLMVMDKTGTLTRGEFKVNQINPEGISEEDLLETAAYAESLSTHPIAASIQEAYEGTLVPGRITEITEISGYGIKALLDGKELLFGSRKLLTENGIAVPETASHGTTVYAALDGQYRGHIAISDSLKDGAKEAVKALKENGIEKTVMLSGDHEKAAVETAREAGVDEVIAELLPEDKVFEVEKLMKDLKDKEKLGFMGDGINDAPVLVRADVGFAMGSLGSDAAIEAADIVLMDDDLRKVPKLLKIAKKTMAIVRANVAFALLVKIGILVLSVFGLAGMWAAVFADVGVAVLCILNSMRALRVKGL